MTNRMPQAAVMLLNVILEYCEVFYISKGTISGGSAYKIRKRFLLKPTDQYLCTGMY